MNKKLMKNLTLIDNKNFWSNEFNSKYNDQEKFTIYRDLKNKFTNADCEKIFQVLLIIAFNSTEQIGKIIL